MVIVRLGQVEGREDLFQKEIHSNQFKDLQEQVDSVCDQETRRGSLLVEHVFHKGKLEDVDYQGDDFHVEVKGVEVLQGANQADD